MLTRCKKVGTGKNEMSLMCVSANAHVIKAVSGNLHENVFAVFHSSGQYKSRLCLVNIVKTEKRVSSRYKYEFLICVKNKVRNHVTSSTFFCRNNMFLLLDI